MIDPPAVCIYLESIMAMRVQVSAKMCTGEQHNEVIKMSLESHMTHVEGKNRGKIMLYTLSTCGWCKKTKNLLKKLGVEYSYIDADLLKGKDQDELMDELEQWNPRCSFPTMVINDEICIVGYKEDNIKEVLDI